MNDANRQFFLLLIPAAAAFMAGWLLRGIRERERKLAGPKSVIEIDPRAQR